MSTGIAEGRGSLDADDVAFIQQHIRQANTKRNRNPNVNRKRRGKPVIRSSTILCFFYSFPWLFFILLTVLLAAIAFVIVYCICCMEFELFLSTYWIEASIGCAAYILVTLTIVILFVVVRRQRQRLKIVKSNNNNAATATHTDFDNTATAIDIDEQTALNIDIDADEETEVGSYGGVGTRLTANNNNNTNLNLNIVVSSPEAPAAKRLDATTKRPANRKAADNDAATRDSPKAPTSPSTTSNAVSRAAKHVRTKSNNNEISLDEPIGEGSHATVFRGRWINTVVAVKRSLLLNLKNADWAKNYKTNEALKRFLDEAALMSCLRHPNIVLLYTTAVEPPYLYLVTEYCDNGSLHSIIHEKKIKLSVEKKLEMALDIARGLNYLHSATPPIIHRDIKCANLLVDKHWTVKVGDFGMSRFSTMSKTMTMCGTLVTMAPEVLCNNRYTEKADVYSYGCVLWEIFAETMLYHDLNVYDISIKVVNEHYRPPIKPEYRMPPFLAQIVQRCWHAEPSVRPSLADIIAALEADIRRRKLNAAPQR